MNYKKISRNYTDYIDMIIDIIKQENLKDKNEIFDVCDNVLKLFKVSKAEYFTNPEAIPDLKLEWKCYDVWCGVGFWSKRQNEINNIDITWLEVNPKLIELYKIVNPDCDIKQFDLLNDDLDWEFSLFWNPPFDRYFKKALTKLMKKAKVSYLMFPSMWLQDLQKEWLQAELVEMWKTKKVFTWKVKNDVWLLFKVYKKDNANNKPILDKLSEEIKKDEPKTLPVDEVVGLIEESNKKFMQNFKDLKKLLQENNIQWGKEEIKSIENISQQRLF